MTPAHQQVCDFLYLHSPVKGAVADNVPGKTLNLLDLQNIIIYVCIAEPTFD